MIELRDRVSSWEFGGERQQGLSAAAVSHDPVREAVSALTTLGYKPQQASRAVAQLQQSGLNSEELIRQALKSMVV